MKIISKEDFQNFVNALIQEESWNVIGVKSRGNKFAFAPLDSAEELRQAGADYIFSGLKDYKKVLKAIG